MTENKIPIVVQNGTPLIWNASDWLKIREEHRIVGNFEGCLVGLPRQETFKGLPVSLLQEEVSLLLEKNLAYILSDSILSEPPTVKSKDKYITYKENNRIEQVQYYEQQRKEQITLMIDRIIEGKRRKLLGVNSKNKSEKDIHFKVEDIQSSEIKLDREEILKNEIEKSTATSNPPILIQTFTSDPWLSDIKGEQLQWNYPETCCEKLKYSIYKDLWNKGYFITEGHKFGVDYLVYPGDPVKFHAQFLIVCLEYHSTLTTVDLSAYTRLGSISRKTFVIATQPPNDTNILYQSVQWTEKN